MQGWMLQCPISANRTLVGTVRGIRNARAFVPRGRTRRRPKDKLRGDFFCGLAAAAAARGRLSGWLADQFRGPDGRDELLEAVIIEIDGGAFGVRFGHDAHSVLLVPNRLPFD